MTLYTNIVNIRQLKTENLKFFATFMTFSTVLIMDCNWLVGLKQTNNCMAY